MKRRNGGFTLIELMITVVIVAIGVALAVPSWKQFVDKRQLTAAAEETASFLEFARSEAVKRNKRVSVHWFSPGGHSSNWCIGLSMAPQITPCDCNLTNPTAANFCAIDGVAARMTQTDYVSMGYEFMHMNPATSSFAFDPVRGIVTDVLNAETADGDWLFRLHSNDGSGSTRLYGLQISLNVTGRTTICAEDDRKSIIAGYKKCQ